MYHALGSEEGSGVDPLYAVDLQRFHEQLALSKEICGGVVSARDWLAGRDGVIFTFDDGLESCFDLGFPALVAAGASADFFVNPRQVGTRGFATWPQLRRMSDAGMSIQSHGLDHRYFLTEVSRARLKEDLHRSRLEIEQNVGRPVTLLAPPGGRSPKDLEDVAIECGYTHVLDSRPGRAVAGRRTLCRMAVTKKVDRRSLEAWLRGGAQLGAKARYHVLGIAKQAMGDRRYQRVRDGLLGARTVSERPRRIVYVVSLFPCWSETFIAREISELISSGVDVQILSLKAPSDKMVQPDAERLLPLVHYPLPTGRAALTRLRALGAHPWVTATMAAQLVAALALRPVDLAKSLEALARGAEQMAWIRDFDPDVIHAHWATFPSTVAWGLGRALGKPFSFTCHAHDIFVNDHLLARKIEAARAAVTISRHNVSWLEDHVTPGARDRMHVIHCGVELRELPYRPDGRKPGFILAVGRLDPIKGFDVLIEAIGELAQQGRSVRCRIVGEGPEEPRLRASVERLGIGEMVELAGAQPQPRVRESLYEASVFVLPSVVTAQGDRDGIPVSLMEAMAAGTPVVSTWVSGIPELIEDGLEGLLVAERDARALAQALGRMLDDRKDAAGMAAAARRKVEREFNVVEEARKLRELLSDGA